MSEIVRGPSSIIESSYIKGTAPFATLAIGASQDGYVIDIKLEIDRKFAPLCSRPDDGGQPLPFRM